MQHRKKQPELLLHPPRIVFGVEIDVVRQSQSSDKWRHSIHRGFHIQAVHPRAKFKYLPPGQIRIENRLVRKKPYQTLNLNPIVKRVTSVDEKRAFRGFEDPHEESKEGRFSGAVRAEQPADLAGRNRKGDVIERDFNAKRLCGMTDFNESRLQ